MNEELSMSFAMIAPDDEMLVEFSDGKRHIAAWIVEEVGGREEMEKLANGLRMVSYEDFIQGVYQVLADRRSQSMVQNMIDGHFSNPFGNL